MTRDLGKSWIIIHERVKAFFWSNSQPKTLLVERVEPNGHNHVLELNVMGNTDRERNVRVVIDNVEDFQIRGDWMFATKEAPMKQVNCSIINAQI